VFLDQCNRDRLFNRPGPNQIPGFRQSSRLLTRSRRASRPIVRFDDQPISHPNDPGALTALRFTELVSHLCRGDAPVFRFVFLRATNLNPDETGERTANDCAHVCYLNAESFWSLHSRYLSTWRPCEQNSKVTPRLFRTNYTERNIAIPSNAFPF